MKKYTYHLFGVILIVVTLGIVFIMMSQKKEPRQDKTKSSVLYVKTADPIISKITTDAHYRGRVVSNSNVTVASEVSGKIEQGTVNLKAGANFRKGDILFYVYSKDERAKIKASKSSFLQLLAKTLPDIKVDYADQFDKWNQFFNQIKLDAPLPELPRFGSNKERIFIASQNILTSYYSLVQEEITLSKYTVRAPFAGNIVQVTKQVGDIANSGAEIAQIIQTDKLEITVPILPYDRKWVSINDQVTITPESGVKVKGSVVRIADFIDESTQSVNIYIRVQNTKEAYLMQGGYVDVNFGGKEIQGMKIPREALVNKDHVYQLKENRLLLHKITVLRQMNDFSVISGFDETAPVVVESISTIDSAMKYLPRK